MATSPKPSLLLFDNGSLRPEPTLSLRRIAGRLAARLDLPVTPTSLLHSDRVDSIALEGQPAVLLESEIVRQWSEGQTQFVLLPFFIGPSGALGDYLPRRLKELRQTRPDLRAIIADSLARIEPAPDLRLAEMLRDRVTTAMTEAGERKPQVIVVDHGSPVREVTALRDRITDRLARLLGPSVHSVRAASMERPEGDAFAFNEPLLDRALAATQPEQSPVLICQLFLAPGRHAGLDGDIATICRAAETANPGLRISITDPIGPHPGMIQLLADRAHEAVDRFQG